MADIISAERRKINMQHIKGRDTTPELYLRKKLFAAGYRYRLYSKKIPGHPDLWLAKYNTAVFVHGCFWHRHQGCRYAYMPKSRIDFWTGKFNSNVIRDRNVQSELQDRRIKVLIIWECTIRIMKKDEQKERAILSRIYDFLVSKDLFEEL